MSANTDSLVEVTSNIKYVYVVIPKEYVCVYHKILVMLADYGMDMLKDCKASCTDRNSGIIECFNMFNAAVAAYKLGQSSLANTLINYVKEKINQIYKGRDNSNSIVFPIDENGDIKAFVTCDDVNRFYIDPSQGDLFNRVFRSDGGIQQQYFLDGDDDPEHDPATNQIEFHYDVEIVVEYHFEDGVYVPLKHEFTIVIYNITDIEGNTINVDDCDISWTLNGVYYDETENVVIDRFTGERLLTVIVYYNGRGSIHQVSTSWALTN